MPIPDDWLASDVAQMEMSAIKEMAMRARTVEGALSLTWGLPSFATPTPVLSAVSAALPIDPDIGKYTLPNGLPELRQRAAEDFAKRSGRQIDPETQAIVTAGNMEGVKTLLRSLITPGDEVIVTDPCFASHLLQIKLSGGRPVFLPLDEEEGWQPAIDQLSDLITVRTKAFLLVTPNNPTGTLLTRKNLEDIGALAEAHDLLVIIDDPYSAFVYESAESYADPAALAIMSDRLAYLFTFSKVYAMSGWRIGYMVLPEGLAPHVLKVHDATMICAPRISQVAALAALSDPALPPPDFKQILDARRELICERLDQVPQLFSYVRPQGAYYVFPRIEGTQESSKAFSIRLLKETGVVVTPGSAFGPSGEGHVRMAYCVDEETIDGAFDRIESFIAHRAF